MPAVYTPRYPAVHVPSRSIFTEIFGGQSDALDRAAPAYIDNVSGAILTRQDVKDLSLSRVWDEDPNSLSWFLVAYAAFAAGLRVSPANTACTPPELAHQLRDSGAYNIFVHPSLLTVLLETLSLLGVSSKEAEKRLEDLMRNGKVEKEEAFDGAQADETALLCYSSGTTGLSKGVTTTHRNLVSQIVALGPATPTFIPKSDIMICILPLNHIYGLVTLAMNCFARGVPMVICPRFDSDLFCSAIQKYKVADAYIAPPVVLFLANPPIVSKYNLASLRRIVSAAVPLAPSLATKTVARLESERANVTLTQDYGLTETSSTCTAHSLAYGADTKHRRPLRRREGDRRQTRATWRAVVPPADLEAVFAHPQIRDAGVIGVKSEDKSTELPRAYITHKAGYASFSTQADWEKFASEVQKWIEGKVAKHKYLRGGVIVIEVIPKSAAGKILRKDLRQLAKEELKSQALVQKLARAKL
ncbi:hypothetical protein BOTBODRAFT_177525 [Botryobasidium botryosum FD-172 SS1]|uniref:AMP-dependent synthetase/ligase domain-containing protein n=1 Tax=Botryobasidium botryosum (strain FD-172 SS1) TaxID=930990 RepID=A0A067M698_BOTB1|nr:hypothetical protein BOTBODRAFT_177525 [Botryobasidium botryosum FD-172 SS1]